MPRRGLLPEDHLRRLVENPGCSAEEVSPVLDGDGLYGDLVVLDLEGLNECL